MNRYYIKFGISSNNNAGSKAIKDIMFLLESKGYKSVLSLPTNTKKIIKLIDIPILILTLLFKVRRNGIILYFVPSNHFRIRILYFFKRIMKYKLICFINDIDSLRMDKNETFRKAEMASISCADISLAPNENSIKILRNEYGFTNHLIPIGVWDYLREENKNLPLNFETSTYNKSVAFAGNLNKAPFINSLEAIDLQFKIWGNNDGKTNTPNICFMGENTPDELVKNITQCAWGLIWDGISIDSCAGTFGSYLRFNNSHKCGLYLAAGIPVIVWKEGGMVKLVDTYKVGICVSSLQEAAERINHMDKDTYNLYRKNAQRISLRISKGEFFLEALEKAEKIKL